MKYRIILMTVAMMVASHVEAQTLWVPSGTGGIGASTNGNVGVGTNTPTAKLEVNHQGGGSGQNIALRLVTGNNSNYFGNSQIQFSYGFGGGYAHAIKSRHNSGAQSGNSLDFRLWQPGDPVNGEGSLSVLTLDGPNVGIGTTTPVSRLDVRSGYVNVVGYNPNDYTFVARSADPGNNDSYFYERITTNFHIVGTSKNGTGLQRKLGFALGGSDSEADIKMSIDNAGRVGIGTTSPSSNLTLVGSTTLEESIINITNNTDQDFQVRVSAANATVKRTMLFPSTPGRLSLGVGVNNEYLTIVNGGNVGIGTTAPDARLAVNGQIHATEVKVTTTVPGPDYVFSKTYSLRSLKDVESYIEANQHLPEVPSAVEMEKEGIKVGEMNMLLLKKVEELTLYVIQLKKELDEVKGVKEKK